MNLGMLENKLQADEESDVNNFINKSALENHCNSLAADCIREIVLQFDIELDADVSEETWLKQIAVQLNSLARQIAKNKLKQNNIEVRNG